MPEAPATPPTSKPAPRQEQPAAPREVRAWLRSLRMSPRKVRLAAATVQRMPALEAVNYLRLLRQAAAPPIAKLIRSAIANARHNFQLAPEALVVKQIAVNQGPTLKRWRARAFGRATPIRRRSSHVIVTLALQGGPAPRGRVKPGATPAEVKTVSLAEATRGGGGAQTAGSAAPAAAVPARQGKGFTRKLFQRKAG